MTSAQQKYRALVATVRAGTAIPQQGLALEDLQPVQMLHQTLLVSHQGIQGVGTDHGVALCIIWGLMLLFMLLSITVTEGVMDWSESPHQMYVPDCKLQTMMYSYTMSREGLFLFTDIKRNLTRKQGVCSRRECYPPKIGDTSPVEFCHKRARAIQEVLYHHADVRGLRVRCVRPDQHRIRGCDGVPQCVAIPHAMERYQGEDQDETRGRSNPNREVEVQCR